MWYAFSLAHRHLAIRLIEKLFVLSLLVKWFKIWNFLVWCKFEFCNLFKFGLFERVATVFGQLWRLEPLPSEKKEMWQREVEWLVSVSDYIVELMPSWQTFPDGSKLEVKLDWFLISMLKSDFYSKGN